MCRALYEASDARVWRRVICQQGVEKALKSARESLHSNAWTLVMIEPCMMVDHDELLSVLATMPQVPPQKPDEGDQGAARNDDDEVASVQIGRGQTISYTARWIT
jgi:hypothetical protein